MKQIIGISLAFVLLLLFVPHLSAEEGSSAAVDVLDMVTGDIQSIPVNGLSRVSMTNPDVADISDAQSDKVSVLGKKAGATILFLWDATGKRSVKIRVVSEDLTAVKDRVQRILDESKVTGVTLEENMDEGKVVVEGSLSKDDKTRLEDILQPYSDNLLNLVKVEKNEDLVEVDMQILEINTTYAENLGIQWGTANGAGVALNYNENLPSGDKFGDLFKIGNFQRQTALQATLNALVSEGKARIISKPRLVVVSGKQASFLVGGEIPQENTTTSASGGIQQSSTTYTQYGVNLAVTPTIRDKKIDVVLNVDIRDVDKSPPMGTTGTAFITRTATTDLLMDNKQTIALAGLIKYEDGVTYSEVPFLSKIPLVGALFRYKQIPGDTNTEMVIILTPVVLTDKKIADKQLAMPTPEERKADKEVNVKYEQETLPAWPLPKAAVVVPEIPSMSAMTAYARMVQVKISKAISYPQAVKGNALAGTVKLKLHIFKDGSLNSEEVINSSGNDILDQDALHAAKTAAPYDAFTTGIEEQDLIFTIPIVYNKLILRGQAPAEKVIASY